MAPREANNPYPDQYLTIEYDATAVMMPHDTGPVDMNDGDATNVDIDDLPMVPPTDTNNIGTTGEDGSLDDDEESAEANDNDNDITITQPPVEVHLPTTMPLPPNFPGDNTSAGSVQQRNRIRGAWNAVNRLNARGGALGGLSRSNHPHSGRPLNTVGSDLNQTDVDPLAIDMTDPDEEEAWDRIHLMIVDAAMTSAQEIQAVANGNGNRNRNNLSRVIRTVPIMSQTSRQVSNDSMDSPQIRSRSSTTESFRGTLVTPSPSIGTRRASLLDQDPSISDDEPDDDILNSTPDLDSTLDTSTATSDLSSTPNTPPAFSALDFTDSQNIHGDVISQSISNSTTTSDATQQAGRFTLSPVRRMRRNERNLFPARPNPTATAQQVNVVSDEDYNSSNYSSNSSFGMSDISSLQGFNDLPMPPSPRRLLSGSFVSGNATRSNSISSTSSGRSIRWTSAFETNSANFDNSFHFPSPNTTSTSSPDGNSSQHNANQINFSFGANTNVGDLKYFAERGCVVHLLRALDTPRLKTLGTRMLADYAKMPHRRVAVASNKRILEFCCRTMLEMPSADNMGTDWPAREYAVETVRSLTATEDSDSFLMGCPGLLKALALIVRGGPFYDVVMNDSPRPSMYRCDTTVNMGLVSGKARLHACIAIMNLSCGKANKLEIASIPEVLQAMRDVMVAVPEHFSPATSSPPVPNGSSSTATPKSVAEEARLKAATCIKNLSNADANDAALLGANGLIEALAHVAVVTCIEESGATHCTTNACLALMNLSISKSNKHRVFKTKGVMDALMTVLARTSPSAQRNSSNANNEARVKACSALSNLAIGYENKIPMFAYKGFVDSILQVIGTDTGEARTKACSILWSFAAEMKNQVPVVQRGDILPTLVQVAEEDHSTEARFKCVAALTLLAESLDNALPLLESGALHPLMDILHEAGADPTQWKGQTASWCVGFLMNMAQSDDAAPFLREAGVVELLAPLLTLEHYQSLKAAMAVTFICRFDEDDETYDLLRKTENVIPKIISLLHNTLSGRGGNGYKYGVFTLRSSVGCISSLASGPEFMKERIATKPVFESLLRVVSDFCVNGGTKGAIVGGGRDDALSATLAIRALHSLTEYMIPIPGSSALPFGSVMDKKMMVALESFSVSTHPETSDETRELAKDGCHRIQRSLGLDQCTEDNDSGSEGFSPRRTVANNIIENSIVASLVQGCCIGPSLHAGDDEGFFPSMIRRPSSQPAAPAAEVSDISDGNESTASGSSVSEGAVRTFLLTDRRTGRLFAVPTDPSGGRAFNDRRPWCYRRGRFCRAGESADPNFMWTDELQAAYSAALQAHRSSSASQTSSHASGRSRGSGSVHGAPQSVSPAGVLK
mmetsp:Transcript_9665/g.12237  ORF Transcript_9665/g.12237 Transcript_9665/m.12237 type:complete len:1363 (-) Transcript_9665:105-4193(-)